MVKTSVKLLAFGIARDIVGGAEIELEITAGGRVLDLREALLRQFPALGKLNSLAIAINNEYANDEQLINVNDEIVLIPPVSGG
ncbi:MAG: MoaD/ThiS family protein [Bacteroidota bacterium]